MQEVTLSDASGVPIYLVRSLFAGMEQHLAVRAVLRGVASGRVFADEAAGQAVVWVQHRVLLGGRPAQNERLAELLREIAATSAARGDYGFGLYYPTPWTEVAPALLAGLQSFPLARQYWQRDLADLPPGQPAVPAGLRLQAVDSTLVEDATLGGVEALREEMCSERPSVADFLARSFGVCLTTDAATGRELAGWCLSEYNCDDRCEVGIETVETYRRQGLATAMTLALCAAAREHGLHSVGWHCIAANQPSAATARRAGFAHVLSYPSHVVQLR